MTDATALTLDELREVAAYAAASAEPALHLFESEHPEDDRPRLALDRALAFATGGRRVAALRVLAAGAHRAAREAHTPAAAEAAMASGHAAAAAYLHPLAQATQVKHILGSAACAARAFELVAGDDHAVGYTEIERARTRASTTVIAVLRRYPRAPRGRSRTAELLSDLDRALRT
ncbi:putative immunity protein [Knoellia sp. CPCC 206453]|uniref:putative immunity protein n=1 Tax=Knoellia pratensis TaxID=3404796 RepID=UPI00360CC13F